MLNNCFDLASGEHLKTQIPRFPKHICNLCVYMVLGGAPSISICNNCFHCVSWEHMQLQDPKFPSQICNICLYLALREHLPLTFVTIVSILLMGSTWKSRILDFQVRFVTYVHTVPSGSTLHSNYLEHFQSQDPGFPSQICNTRLYMARTDRLPSKFATVVSILLLKSNWNI